MYLVNLTTPPSNLIIFGAKSLALGASQAIQTIHPDIHVEGFVVTSRKGNPSTLNNLHVYELAELTDKEICILIATPQDIQMKIVDFLDEQGFHNHICMIWELEAELMGAYYAKQGGFLVLPGGAAPVLPATAQDEERTFAKALPEANCYMAKFYRDKQVQTDYPVPAWVQAIQVGAALTDERVAALTDDIGENISARNVNYCELTALYWIWKNRLAGAHVETAHTSEVIGIHAPSSDAYAGVYQYRRLLDINDAQLAHLAAYDVDVVLPYPTMCEPDIFEHHERYVKSSDWDAMVQALEELHPEYMETYHRIFKGNYMYNYNILLAKETVLCDYCAWLFPILERTEELSDPKGWERADRYIGYLGENLETLYFMHHAEDYKILHTGRVMLV